MDFPNVISSTVFFMQLKLEIRSILATFIDEFTFKILGNIERNMMLSGLNVATYNFESSVFKMELYTLRDIPMPMSAYVDKHK